MKDGNNFCIAVSKPCLFIAIQLCWNFKPCCFYFFPKSALLNWGCGLSMDAAYTRTFTVSPDVVLFFRSERSGGNFITICFIFQFSVSHQPETSTRNRIANGKRHLGRLICWFWKNPYHYLMVTPTGLFWQIVSIHVLIAFVRCTRQGKVSYRKHISC